MVILEQTAESLAADNFTIERANAWLGLDEFILQPLMVALGVKMENEVLDRVPQHRFAEEYHPVEAFFLDQPDPAFRVGVQAWQPWRQSHRRHALALEYLAELPSDLRVPVHEKVRLAAQKAILPIREVLATAAIQAPSGCAVIAAICTRRVLSSITNRIKKVTSPFFVQTSAVKKSHAANVSKCVRIESV